MNTNESVTLEQQRERRNRINRMKTGIIIAIAAWMIVSLIALIVLSIQVVHLTAEVRILSGQRQSEVPTEKIHDTQEETQSGEAVTKDKNIVTGIDSPDNIAGEGDQHKVYLTFDGCPSANTDAILDVLDKYGVKATFFVVGDKSDEMKQVYRRIAEDGHTMGMHSYSNQYSKIYASTDAFEKDFDKLSDYLEEVTGVKSQYYRFPGGSSNEISNVDMSEFVHILNEKKITYFDWNVSAGDAASEYSVDDVVKNVTSAVTRYKTSVVLLHDGMNKSTTVEALGPLIEALKKMDALILPIDENTKVIQYIKADSVE